MWFAQLILMWVGIGAIVGFIYAWGRATPATERSLKKIKSFPIDDSEMRRSRQRTIGRIQRLRLRASTVGASVGAVLGATVGLFVWLTGFYFPS
jgi:hypothetical protein